MHVLNIMLSSTGGGIEQAICDYCRAQRLSGHHVTAITHPDAWINTALKTHDVPTVPLRNFGGWDWFAALRLRKLLKSLKPDIVITHANRALALMKKAGGEAPLVGVAHNYSLRHFTQMDAAFAPTLDLIRLLVNGGLTPQQVFHMPNMIECDRLPCRQERRNPPVIGAMGRFVTKKGFGDFIKALEILYQRQYEFRAVLAGDGELMSELRQQVRAAGLEDIVSFPGWVDGRAAFYNGIDIFCVPSLHEPFGIVLLEAFAHGVPVVATLTEGPCEIITHYQDGLLVPKGQAEELASALALLLVDEALAAGLAARGFVRAKTTYSLETVSRQMDKALCSIAGSSA